MSKKQKIVSIEVELKDYEPIRFTMDEAKELYEQLHSLFGDKTVRHVHHYDNWWRQPYYTWYSQSGERIPSTYTISGNSMSTNDLVGKAVSSGNTQMKVSYNG